MLHKAVLKGADLLLTDFQGASLLQADLQGANLLGAKLQDANLQGATLEDASGLQGEQLAGANLFGAALPAQVSVQSGLQHLRGIAKLSGWLTLAMAALCALAYFRIITTTDIQLLVNAPVLPVSDFRICCRWCRSTCAVRPRCSVCISVFILACSICGTAPRRSRRFFPMAGAWTRACPGLPAGLHAAG